MRGLGFVVEGLGCRIKYVGAQRAQGKGKLEVAAAAAAAPAPALTRVA